jgi:hypothetical protein
VACKPKPLPVPDGATAIQNPANEPHDEEPSASQKPLADAAPAPPQAPEVRKLLAPIYESTRACLKEHPPAGDDKGPFEVRMTGLANGGIVGVEVVGQPEATACLQSAVREKLRLRPWTGNAMEIRLPVSANGEPIYLDGGSAPR